MKYIFNSNQLQVVIKFKLDFDERRRVGVSYDLLI